MITWWWYYNWSIFFQGGGPTTKQIQRVFKWVERSAAPRLGDEVNPKSLWNYDRNLTGIITRRHWVYHGLHLIYSHIVSLSLKLCSWAGCKPMLYLYIYIYTCLCDYTDGYISDIQPAWGYVPLGECLNITFAHLFVRDTPVQSWFWS